MKNTTYKTCPAVPRRVVEIMGCRQPITNQTRIQRPPLLPASFEFAAGPSGRRYPWKVSKTGGKRVGMSGAPTWL